ncbi:hypothetical protein OCH239_10865 [Roseivivax halodurans JCM 10272]|uniref:Uncharacterized protein n=1 Tax=Roseivivax halodurans JCM 10272 TaxID=1449350 RepID=X7EDS4_9RHOB|nr:hypothetical protein [Roseivivax halodurans]ETX13336.1 hypothetical protein OCH239_10865 [Roseivivax halodurans JCM 10272]
MSDDTPPSSIERWLAQLLNKLEVASIEASFSGGGDEGSMDDMIVAMRPGATMSGEELLKHLDTLEQRSVGNFRSSFRDKLVDQIEHDASYLGDYANNEGGSVFLRLEVEGDAVKIAVGDFTPGSYDDDEDYDYDEEDLEP